MKYQLRNARTKRVVLDAITRKPRMFDDLEMAEGWSRSLERDSVIGGTAWNSVRPTKYLVETVNDEKPICPYCERNETETDKLTGGLLLCMACAEKLADRQDRIEHQNRCDW